MSLSALTSGIRTTEARDSYQRVDLPEPAREEEGDLLLAGVGGRQCSRE